MPQIVPFDVPKFSPAGNVALISQDIICPGPVMDGINGKSLLTVLFVRINSVGE